MGSGRRDDGPATALELVGEHLGRDTAQECRSFGVDARLGLDRARVIEGRGGTGLGGTGLGGLGLVREPLDELNRLGTGELALGLSLGEPIAMPRSREVEAVVVQQLENERDLFGRSRRPRLLSETHPDTLRARSNLRSVANICTIAELEALYDDAVPASRIKELDHLTDEHRAYVDASPFVVVATAGPGGLDCSPRGDPAGFVRVVDERTLMMPDRRGNNRLDSLRNLVVDPRIGLLFLVPGVGVTLRINGTATICTDRDLCASFAMVGKLPASVIVVTTTSVYTQCPKALIRSRLWDPEQFRDPGELPSVGQVMQAINAGEFDGKAYDEAYPQRVRETIY